MKKLYNVLMVLVILCWSYMHAYLYIDIFTYGLDSYTWNAASIMAMVFWLISGPLAISWLRTKRDARHF